MILETYNFNKIKDYIEFNKVSGIYALIHNNEVIYVGQSKDVRGRLITHHKVDYQIEFYSKPKEEKYEPGRINSLNRYKYLKENMDNILFIVLPLPINDLNSAEEYYINKYKPRFNYSGVKTSFYPVPRAS